MNQEQREALIDLLNLAILTDSHLSIKEDEQLQAAIESIGWDSPRPREIHILNSISRARRATDTDEATANFIRTRCAVFTTAASKETALSVLKSVLASDTLSQDEESFLDRLAAAF